MDCGPLRRLGIVGLSSIEAPILAALATESPLTTGTFGVTRSGPTTAPLTVLFTRSGTATAGTDYLNFPLSLTIPLGASSADLTVTPIPDTGAEGLETLILGLAANPPTGSAARAVPR